MTSAQVESFKEQYGVTVIATNCDKELAEDKSLPVDSYLITLESEGEKWQDIVKGVKVKIFDAYYDNFNHCMKEMVYTSGTVSVNFGDLNKKIKRKRND